ncbi:MAG: PspC domain-containing protein [Pseudomonadota bacterium]
MASTTGSNRGRRPQTDHEFDRAMRRLEDAVRDLGSTGRETLADRAASFLEDAADKLKQEARGGADDAPRGGGYADDGERRGVWGRSAVVARPGRDPYLGRVGGVCAGLAPYLGVQIWVLRFIAVSCLIFMPQVILPAYFIAYFVLDEVEYDGVEELPARSRRRWHKRRVKRARRSARASRVADVEIPSRRASAGRSAKPEPSGQTLRSVRGTLDEAERRLREMEGAVTSDRFQLQRELNAIDRR